MVIIIVIMLCQVIIWSALTTTTTITTSNKKSRITTKLLGVEQSIFRPAYLLPSYHYLAYEIQQLYNN